jgi:hypothetical protein
MLFFFHLFMGNSVPHVIVHKDLSLIVSTALYIKINKITQEKNKNQFNQINVFTFHSESSRNTSMSLAGSA